METFLYIHKGSKFNCRKEVVIGEKYLVIKILRFYLKCSNCLAEISVKTDPQNSDYVVECGATRNFDEAWRDEEEATTTTKKREEEEVGDGMKSLDIVAALDELKSMKSRRATVSSDDMLAALKKGKTTETLTKTSNFNSCKNGETVDGYSILKPKFILKPRPATDGPPPNKKHKHATESTVNKRAQLRPNPSGLIQAWAKI